jgi:hypothetical protein
MILGQILLSQNIENISELVFIENKIELPIFKI